MLLLGGVLGVFALIEFWLEYNPILADLYASAQFPLTQKWATYRVTTTLGHPLNNALFFAITFSLAAGGFVRRRRVALVIVAALSFAGVVLTASRGGILAIAAGALYLTGLYILDAGRFRLVGRIVALLAFAALAAAAIYSPLVAGRSESAEAVASTNVRFVAADVALQVARNNYWLGAGAGASAPATAGIGPDTLVIESSYLQLLVSLGIIGLIAILSLVIRQLWFATKLRDLDSGAAIVAMTVSAGTFNFIEANRPLHIIFGLVLALATGPTGFTQANGVSDPKRDHDVDVEATNLVKD